MLLTDSCPSNSASPLLRPKSKPIADLSLLKLFAKDGSMNLYSVSLIHGVTGINEMTADSGKQVFKLANGTEQGNGCLNSRCQRTVFKNIVKSSLRFGGLTDPRPPVPLLT